MKILDTLELKSSKIKLGSNVLELPKKDGVIATLGDLSNSEQDVVFGDLDAGVISASCGIFDESVKINGNVSVTGSGSFNSISSDEILIGNKSVATEEYVDTCILTLEGEVQEAVDELSAKISSVYKYVGSVETEEALEALDTTNLNNGDVYNVTATDENWALIKTETETKWDKLGSTIDLAPYALKTDVSGCIAAVEAKIPTDYIPAIQCHCGGIDHYVVGSSVRFIDTLIYGESEVATTNDILPVTKCTDTTTPIYSNSNACLEVSGVIANSASFSGGINFSSAQARCICVETSLSYRGYDVATKRDILPVTKGDETIPIYSNSNACLSVYGIIANSASFLGPVNICGKAVAIESYVDQAESDANKYTDDCVAALNIGDYAKKSEVLTVIKGCIDEVEAKIPDVSNLLSYTTENGPDGFSGKVVEGPLKIEDVGLSFELCNGFLSFKNSSGEIISSINCGGIYCGHTLTTKKDVDDIIKCCTITIHKGCSGIDFVESNAVVFGCTGDPSNPGSVEFDGSANFKTIPTYNGSDDIVIDDSGCGKNTPVFVTDDAVIKYVGEKIEDVEDKIENIEGKIPTDYLPASKSNSGCYSYSVSGGVEFTGKIYGCINGYYTSSEVENLLGFNAASSKEYTNNAINNLCIQNYATREFATSTANQAAVGCADYALSQSKSYTDEKIASLGSVLEYKGNKTYVELPTEGNDVGDVYNITADYEEKGIKAGDNVVWNGSDWDVLSGPIDLSGYYDKSEVDDKLEGYLPITSKTVDDLSRDFYTIAKNVTFGVDYSHVKYDYNTLEFSIYQEDAGGVVMSAKCGFPVNFPILPTAKDSSYQLVLPNKDEQLTPKKYVDDKVKTATDAIATLSDCVYTKTEVDTALEGYLPVNGTCWLGGKNGYLVHSLISFTDSIPITYGDPLNKADLLMPTDDGHLTNKKYVDDSISTLESTVSTDYATKVELQSVVDNGVLTEDIALTGGSLSGDQFSWEIEPSTGISKLLAVVTMDSDGNIVTPTYKWDKTNKKVKVTVYSTTDVSDNTYTTTITYKK